MDMDFILKNTSDFRENLVKRLKDSDYAREFLNASLEAYKEDGNEEAYSRAIEYVKEAQGGIDKLYDLGRVRRERKVVFAVNAKSCSP